MNDNVPKTKLFQTKNMKIFNEEKPKIHKIQESQLKKFSYYPQPHYRNSLMYYQPSFDFPTEQSDKSKKLNITKTTVNNNTHNNSLSDNLHHIKFSQNKTRLHTDLNLNEDSSNINFTNSINNNYTYSLNNNYSNSIHNINLNQILIESVFKHLEIDIIYLEKMYLNKIDFSDLLVLNKEDLKEMNIPIGPRNRLLNFINNFSIYKENFKIKKIDLNTLNQFFKEDGYLSINKKNQISKTIYSMNSPTINIKTKYNNNFSTNVGNNILINQEIKKYLCNNPNNLTIRLNKIPFQENKSNSIKGKYIKKSVKKKSKKNIIDKYKTIETSSNFGKAISERQNKNNLNIEEIYDKNYIKLNKKENNQYSKNKLIPGTNYSKNSKQFIIFDYKNSKNNNKMNQNKNDEEKYKENQKTIMSFSDEGLVLLSKMKKNLHDKLKNYAKSIGEKKLLLKLLEGNTNVNDIYDN